MKITIELLSDICIGSGESYNSVIDTDVTYDDYGLPYIPAKRIKGCIREAGLELKDFGLIKATEFEEIFGREGDQSSAFSLSNAYLSNYEETCKALDSCGWEDLKSPQNVLNQYTYTRTSTAVDLETGVADKNTLRTIRVIEKGLKFEAECNWKREVSNKDVLKQAVSLVKHIGISRTRGLGLVRLALEEEKIDQCETKCSRIMFTKDKLGEKNKIKYTIHLNSAVICKSPQGNQAVTQDYISGSKILGLIAEGLKDKYQEFMNCENEVIVSNAYVMNDGKRCVPARISLQKEKDQSYDENGNLKLKDMILLKSADEIRGKQMTPANIPYIDETGTKVEVTTQISYHHQRPADKSVGKATGTDGSSFYQLASISRNQDFCGYIYADKKQAEMIMDVMESLNEVRIGYGRSSEFGAVDLKLESVEPVSVKSETCKDAVITLASDVILYNEMGMLTTDIRVLEQVLRNVTGAADLVLRNPFLRFETIGGYNVTWRRRKPVFSALGKGSTFLIHSDIGFDIGKLDGSFIGERISEGYGEILGEKIFDSLDVTVRKRELSKEEPEMAEKNSEMAKPEQVQINSDILARLLQNEFAGRMENAIREIWEEKKKKYKDSLDGLNAGIAKLRAIFKAVNSYEEMQEQVEGIEKNEKNSLCKDLIGFVNPCEVAETITEEMKESYTSEFENQWSEEETFRQAYLFYLAELKYFVKELLNSKKEEKKK